MNIKRIVKGIKEENQKIQKQIEERIIRAFEEVDRLKADFLKIDPEMEKMILFGSLVENIIESMDFDIDIAVRSNKYYQLVSRALQSEFKVDLVDLDSAHERIKKNIIKNGRIVYEKKQG